MAKRVSKAKAARQETAIDAAFMTGWKVVAGLLRERGAEATRQAVQRFVQREAKAVEYAQPEYVRGLRAAFYAATSR